MLPGREPDNGFIPSTADRGDAGDIEDEGTVDALESTPAVPSGRGPLMAVISYTITMFCLPLNCLGPI